MSEQETKYLIQRMAAFGFSKELMKTILWIAEEQRKEREKEEER